MDPYSDVPRISSREGLRTKETNSPSCPREDAHSALIVRSKRVLDGADNRTDDTRLRTNRRRVFYGWLDLIGLGL